jgi:hypothetical protein
MEQALPAISSADLYARLGTASAPTVVDVALYTWCRSLQAETHNWPATLKQARHG